jgi:peroxiredoxin
MQPLRTLLLSVVALAATALSAPLVAERAFAGGAPDFSLRDINGVAHTLSENRGKVVLLNFWATWCGPCQVEMPHLQALSTELGPQGLVVLGVSTDDAKLDAAVKPLVKSKGLTYTILRDPQTTVVSQFNPAKTLPFNVLIGRDGAVARQHSGYNPGDEVTLKAEIVELLAK